MRIQFYLARKDKKETVIVANIHLSAKLMRVSTGITVESKYWNPKTHRVRISPSYRQGSSINNRLNDMQALVEKCYHDYLTQNDAEPTLSTFKEMVSVILGKQKRAKVSFFEYWKDFIARTKAGQRQNAKGKIIAPRTGSHYTVTYNTLQAFNSSLNFDDIDFYQDFIKWLRAKGYAENNIGSHIKRIKSVLNEATEKGINKNLAYQSKRFIVLREDVDNIALTLDELEALEVLPLKGREDNVRDLFLIGCYTGLRFSDFSRLDKSHIKGDFIEIKTQKTGKTVAIPIHDAVRRILKKHEGSLPKSISNQKTNDTLKEICKQVALLKELSSKTRTQGGMKVTRNSPKWQLVSTHTARRTFATNAYLQGVPTLSIMAVTGHKTEAAFLKYIKVTPKEHAKIMAAKWKYGQAV